MKLLITSDLHGNYFWYNWLVSNTKEYDTIIIAGDIIDAFDVHREIQIGHVYDELIRLSEIKKKVLLCSGNHDSNNIENGLGFFIKCNLREDIKPKIFNLDQWFNVFKPHIDVDGTNTIIDDNLFTILENNEFTHITVHQRNIETINSALLLRPSVKKWYIIHHQPPINTSLCKAFESGGSQWIRDVIQEHRPDFVLSGHIHGSPFVEGGNWYEKINNTVCFNAGCCIDKRYHSNRSIPCHIILDTETNDAKWWNTNQYIEIKL